MSDERNTNRILADIAVEIRRSIPPSNRQPLLALVAELGRATASSGERVTDEMVQAAAVVLEFAENGGDWHDATDGMGSQWTLNVRENDGWDAALDRLRAAIDSVRSRSGRAETSESATETVVYGVEWTGDGAWAPVLLCDVLEPSESAAQKRIGEQFNPDHYRVVELVRRANMPGPAPALPGPDHACEFDVALPGGWMGCDCGRTIEPPLREGGSGEWPAFDRSWDTARLDELERSNEVAVTLPDGRLASLTYTITASRAKGTIGPIETPTLREIADAVLKMRYPRRSADAGTPLPTLRNGSEAER